MAPAVSVVVATRDRPERLGRLLESLRAQSVERDAFEIVVVDDASAVEVRAGDDVRLVRRADRGGPAAARNDGWRAASAPVVAFTDDDCEVVPNWLEAGLRVLGETGARFVQGPIVPNPAEATAAGPFTHTVESMGLGPWYPAANTFYSRAVLERLGGFDEDAFPGGAGADTDLAWRAIEAGAEPAWADDAVVLHAVEPRDPLARLRVGPRAEGAVTAYQRHPGLRATLHARAFAERHHVWLARAVLALLVPTRLWPVRWWLAAPYVERVTKGNPLLAPYVVAADVAEVVAYARASLRRGLVVL